MARGRVVIDPGVNVTRGNEPALLRALRALASSTGRVITITSGWRSYQQQAAIYNSGVRPAARPGSSQHELGDAADATIGGKPFWQVISAGLASKFGLATYPGGTTQDPVHVELASATNVVGHASASSSKAQKFDATAYGPPWGGIQGGGTTATGINLSGAPHRYIVAVDPSVIPLHTKLRIWPNPFSNRAIIFSAEDTGGAIKGNRIDFYDWRGRKTQMAWGERKVNVETVNGANSTSFGRTRPGGDPSGDSSAALDSAFAYDFADNPTGTGPQVSDTGQGGTENVVFGLPGGFPLPGLPGLPLLPGIPNPLDLFKTTKDAINSGTDFLKWVAWIFHPRNILRVVEFLTGLTIMGFGLHVMIEAHKGGSRDEQPQDRVKRAVNMAVQASPVGRTVRVARGARAGKQAAQAERRREEFNTARKRARRSEQQRGRRQSAERSTRKKYGDKPPF